MFLSFSMPTYSESTDETSGDGTRSDAAPGKEEAAADKSTEVKAPAEGKAPEKKQAGADEEPECD